VCYVIGKLLWFIFPNLMLAILLCFKLSVLLRPYFILFILKLIMVAYRTYVGKQLLADVIKKNMLITQIFLL